MPDDHSKALDGQTARIVEDLRKETLETVRQFNQAQTEISKAVATIAGPYVELVQQLREVQKNFVSWVEVNREEIRAFQAGIANAVHLGVQFGNLVADASKQVSATLERTDHIAKLGWTFPCHFYFSDLVELAQLETREDADSYVLQWYDENDASLERMERRICGHVATEAFRTVLPQCFNSIRRGDYSIAIPQLIAVLENVILRLNPPNLLSRDVKKALQAGGRVARDAKRQMFAAAMWLSLATFVSELYVQVPAISPNVAPVLSRHGIQHGRFEAPNVRAEAIRVLHAIDTALSLSDRLGRQKQAVDAPPRGKEAH